MTGLSYAFGSPVPSIRHTPGEDMPRIMLTGEETELEYGFARPGRPTLWPDDDGELMIGGDWRSARPESDDEVAALRREAVAAGGKLVRRTLTRSAPEDVPAPLPTTPGSVVRATYQGRTVYAFLSDVQRTRSPWCLDRMVGGVLYVPESSLSEAVTVFEPTT